jgi:hypothetical protein
VLVKCTSNLYFYINQQIVHVCKLQCLIGPWTFRSELLHLFRRCRAMLALSVRNEVERLQQPRSSAAAVKVGGKSSRPSPGQSRGRRRSGNSGSRERRHSETRKHKIQFARCRVTLRDTNRNNPIFVARRHATLGDVKCMFSVNSPLRSIYTIRQIRRCTAQHTKIELILFLPYDITCRIHNIPVGLCN